MYFDRRKFFPVSVAFFSIATVITLAVVLAVVALPGAQNSASAQTGDAPGSLIVLGTDGKPKATCPLKQTQVKAEISGFLARVNVSQEFENPFKEKIEAVYTFPLPQNAAVDEMTMTIGERVVRGRILRREEAQAVYDAAKNNGQVASLLDQERPNIFTQSVANILPGEKVTITISYVETLKYEAGVYEFMFPMVVGPRYVPGTVTGSSGNGFSGDTERVPDGSRITPRPTSPTTRSGHDITLDIGIDAGVSIDAVGSQSHAVKVERTEPRYARIQLKSGAVIPNKDFVLRYDVGGKGIQDALITHRSANGGFFTLILQPPDRAPVEDVTPKELVFVLDTSGSMSGFPIEKAKETMKLALDGLNPADTFNLITFAGDTRVLFPEPVAATPINLRKAQAFLSSSSGSGGTEMMTAIRTSLEPSDSQQHLRIVCFMTDGYVGNDMEIISEIQKHPNARVFAFGIGSSVNRFLLDKMAEHGRGEVEYVALTDDGSAAAKRFHERVRSPLLTDISIDWNGLPVADIYPGRIPDLFSAKPLILTGRYTGAGKGVVRLKGKVAGEEFLRELAVDLPDAQAQHNVLPALWARRRIEDLMAQDYEGAQRGSMRPELQETITNLGLEYRLLTQFTSFVAVEEMIVTDGGQPRRIEVPVEMPEGVTLDRKDTDQSESFAKPSPTNVLLRAETTKRAAKNPIHSGKVAQRSAATMSRVGTGSGSGGGGGAGSGASGRPSGIVTINESANVISADAEIGRELATRVHPAITALINRLKNKQAATVGEAKFVRDGKAEIQVWLNDKTPETIAKLKELGFEIILDAKGSKVIIGKLPIEKLETLSQLAFVRYVSPQLIKPN